MKIGILGAGQLGRMLALSGLPLEHQFFFYDPSGNPTAGIGTIYADQSETIPEEQLISSFLEQVDVVTYEFENISHPLTLEISKSKPLYPSPESIRICQNRKFEKQLFSDLGIPTSQYHIASSLQELQTAVDALGVPVVVKSITEGYDGKGQAVIREVKEIEEAWHQISHPELLVESFVNFKRELSIIAVRSQSGEIHFYPLTENIHHNGILRYSIAPAPMISAELQNEAESYIRALLEAMNHIGVLTLELFETNQGLIANEMAPRVHNSGHWSIEGAQCSQFENHIRAVAGHPLGSTEADRVSCMINIIGKKGDLNQLLSLPYVNIHLYDKEERENRKLGHITIQADSYKELLWRVENVADLLPENSKFSCSLNKAQSESPGN
jgi:5-(carboxyamino)imidazole ribonucleotide synthase